MKLSAKIMSIYVLFALSFVSLGCGGASDQPDLGTVHGTVSLDGEPLTGVIVIFSPEEGRQSVGVTDESGAYELKYTGESLGAKIGKHTVGFTASDDEDVKASAAIPPKYAAGASTELTVEVKAGDNTHDFDLSSK